MKTVQINLYSFNELSEKAKEKAIYEQIDFLNSIPVDYEDEHGQMKEEYIEHTPEDAIESILINEYLFFTDGEMANCVTYVNPHPKKGITELKFKGEIYIV